MVSACSSCLSIMIADDDAYWVVAAAVARTSANYQFPIRKGRRGAPLKQVTRSMLVVPVIRQTSGIPARSNFVLDVRRI